MPAVESRAAFVDSVCGTPTALTDAELAAFDEGTIAPGVETDEGDIDDMLYGVFVDTRVFYAHHDRDASRHDFGCAALRGVLGSAAYGHMLTSDDIYDKVVTLTHRRTGDLAATREVGCRLRRDGYPDAVEILHAAPRRFAGVVNAASDASTTAAASPTR